MFTIVGLENELSIGKNNFKESILFAGLIQYLCWHLTLLYYENRKTTRNAAIRFRDIQFDGL